MYDVFIYSINTIVHISVNSVVYKVKTCFTAVCILHIGLAFAIALSAYTGFQRITASSNTTSGGTNRRRGVGWSGGGANIRGVKDLPKDPSGG